MSRVSDRSETTPRRDPWSLRLPPSRPAEGAWLAEALRELDEVAGGVDVDGPQPSREVVAEARSLLRHLAGWVDGAPAVDDDADGGVGIEFYGPEGRRLLLIVEADGSAIYQELIAGDVLTERFEDWRQLLGISAVLRSSGWGFRSMVKSKPTPDLRANERLGRRCLPPAPTLQRPEPRVVLPTD
ncbi:MAG: hypothetical protein OXE58_12910 [Acidobacteria bacterium]|nr:hypothetical protein [Acidobacteriota bacterium]